MNDLGMAMAWSAVQVSFLMVPAAVLQVLASRRSAASGAWVAAVSLLLSVAISIATFLPWPRARTVSPGVSTVALATSQGTETNHDATTNDPQSDGVKPSLETRRHDGRLSLSFAAIQNLFQRLERRAAAPAALFRKWGTTLAVAGIIGAGFGLLRLLLGLWAVRLCRRRGTVLDDPQLIDLLDEVRAAIGCPQVVEICEVRGLCTPATAGWRNPVILLPDDWRSWDQRDRKAVLAHELAHVKRRDYAMGLAARLALALNFYHPMVRWMAGRLLLQQEFAADLVGARFAGGRDSYLSTLSCMALKQDARCSYWPARAFLPARGTLVRRIEMLQKESVAADRPWSGSRRMAAAVCLLGLAVIAAMWRGPVRAAGNDEHSGVSGAPASNSRNDRKRVAAPFDLRFASENSVGVVACRPAATFRRPGLARFPKLISQVLLTELAMVGKVDLAAPNRLTLSLDDIEWIAAGLSFGRAKYAGDKEWIRHSLAFKGLTIRTTAPFDWPRFLREWGFELHKVEEGNRVYYKALGPLKLLLGMNPCVYLPDDRTIVLDEEAEIQKLVRRQNPVVPAYLTGPDWERVSRGILAVAIHNQDGAFAKEYDLGRHDDAVVLSLFKGVDRWVFGVDDADAIALHASAACGEGASATIARAVESLVKSGRDAMTTSPEPATPATEFDEDRVFRAFNKTLLANLRVGHDDRSVDLRAEGFGTLADFFSLVEASVNADLAAAKRIKDGAK